MPTSAEVLCDYIGRRRSRLKLYHVTFVLNRVSGTSVVSPEGSSGLSRPDEEGQEVVAGRFVLF
jgi:hypothetical protein